MARRLAVASKLHRAICGEAALTARQEQSGPATPLCVNQLLPETRETYEMLCELGWDSPPAKSTHSPLPA
jgi:hypothetical protein